VVIFREEGRIAMRNTWRFVVLAILAATVATIVVAQEVYFKDPIGTTTAGTYTYRLMRSTAGLVRPHLVQDEGERRESQHRGRAELNLETSAGRCSSAFASRWCSCHQDRSRTGHTEGSRSQRAVLRPSGLEQGHHPLAQPPPASGRRLS